MDCWYKKVLETPIVLNPVTLAVFIETLKTLNPKDVTYNALLYIPIQGTTAIEQNRTKIMKKDVTYKNRLKKWMIESPTVEL